MTRQTLLSINIKIQSVAFFDLRTSHNSSILHKQSHALLCSSFEQCVDFYLKKKGIIKKDEF